MKKTTTGKMARKKATVRPCPKGASVETGAPKASTIRLRPELQSALDAISNHLDRPKNKIVNQAVAEFLEKTTFRLKDDLEGTLRKLNAYRIKDPHFETEIERFVVAESTGAAADNHEGQVRSKAHSPLKSEIRDMIHA